MKLFINNGTIVDPAAGLYATGDLIIEDGIIREVVLKQGQVSGSDPLKGRETGNNIARSAEEDVSIDAGGKWVVPGLVDLHVHFREPGFEYKEDIASGCRSAAKGGVTTVCCMPNTNPVIDNSYVVLMVNSRAEEANEVQVLCVGAVTKGQEGRELADYEAMAGICTDSALLPGKGICGISEDGKTLRDAELMLAAMKKAKELGLTYFSHAEPEAEIVERDIALAEASGCRLHFCHISEKRSVELIREAKKRGVSVTAETAPHYFTLTMDDVGGDPNKKMNPPLRGKEDREAIRQGLQDGTLDVIATDHAPHSETEKNLPFAEAPNGVIGLETSFAVSYTELVRTGILTPLELISKMSAGPAEILGIDRGSLQVGKAADLAIIDVEKEYEVDPVTFASKGRNTPFAEKKVYGQVDYTLIGGRIDYRSAEAE
ncbi:MAG TPA: dihydroorotase [Anaerovoracaceae bacterium]|nr:dihydroorotase [Anaerovoracaceae bacterium]